MTERIDIGVATRDVVVRAVIDGNPPTAVFSLQVGTAIMHDVTEPVLRSLASCIATALEHVNKRDW